MVMRQAMNQKIRDLFSIDLRTLAVFRICLASMLLLDLFWRAFDLTAFYTDHGVMPRHVLLGDPAVQDYWSLYFAGGEVWFAGLLFIINAIVLIALLLGCKTRLMTVLAWVLLVSLLHRNGLILSGADRVLRLLLFWSMFLPLGAVWSLDSKANKDKAGRSFSYYSLGTVALYYQFLMIYFFAWVTKTDSSWWPDGTALSYALNMTYLTTPLGRWLSQAPAGVLKMLTFAVYWLECLIPILFFFVRFRMVLAVIIVLLHIGFRTGLELGMFTFAGGLTAIMLIPGLFWEKPFVQKFQQRIAGAFTRLKAWGRWFQGTGQDLFYPNRMEQVLIVLCLLGAFAGNMDYVSRDVWTLPEPLRRMVNTTGIYQRWRMFAPHPFKTSRWLTLEGRTDKGENVNLLREDGPGPRKEPDYMAQLYKNERWAQISLILRRERGERYRQPYMNYFCREWNRKHIDDPVKSAVLSWFWRSVDEPRNASTPTERVLLSLEPCPWE